MSETKAIIAIAAGCAALIFAFTSSQGFYAKGLFGVSQSSRKMPVWLGRTIALVVAALFLTIGIAFFVSGS